MKQLFNAEIINGWGLLCAMLSCFVVFVVTYAENMKMTLLTICHNRLLLQP